MLSLNGKFRNKYNIIGHKQPSVKIHHRVMQKVSRVLSKEYGTFPKVFINLILGTKTIRSLELNKGIHKEYLIIVANQDNSWIVWYYRKHKDKEISLKHDFHLE